MILLNEPDKKHLLRINAAAKDPLSSIKALKKLCAEVAIMVGDKGFPYTYAASLVASQGRIDEAIKLLSHNRDDPFSSVLYNYLVETGDFKPQIVVFENASPYNAFVKTNFYKRHVSGILKHIRKFAKETPPPAEDETFTILDVGTGNGVLISKIVNEIIPIFNIKNVRLALLDPSVDMLQTAERVCKKDITADTDITTICCRAQELTEEHVRIIRSLKPIWFINLALSIHHMPWEKKIPLLKLLKGFSPFCILSEVNENNDRPEKDSPDLVYSVARGYGHRFRDILTGPLSDEEKKSALYHFLLAEALNILREERPERIDYHTTIEEWKKLAKEAGFATGTVSPTVVDSDGFPWAFVMDFKDRSQ